MTKISSSLPSTYRQSTARWKAFTLHSLNIVPPATARGTVFSHAGGQCPRKMLTAQVAESIMGIIPITACLMSTTRPPTPPNHLPRVPLKKKKPVTSHTSSSAMNVNSMDTMTLSVLLAIVRTLTRWNIFHFHLSTQ